MMLSLLISSPKQPGNDIDVYLAPLIEDLKILWDVGVDVFDDYRKQTFNLRVVLKWTISDFPAYRNLSRCTVKGYYSCPVCGINTYACHYHIVGKCHIWAIGCLLKILLGLCLV